MSAHRETRSRDHLSKTIAVGLLVVVVFTALAFGTVEPWSVFVFEVLVASLLSLWFIKAIADKRITLSIPQIAWPIVALTVVGLAQSGHVLLDVYPSPLRRGRNFLRYASTILQLQGFHERLAATKLGKVLVNPTAGAC